jgi:hypothetical protein
MKSQRNSLSEQLQGVSHMLPKNKRSNLPSLVSIGRDGTEHINIWEFADTNLGRVLSSFTCMPFKHSIYGKFDSMEGFWYYIKSVSKDDNLRHLSGFNARTFGKTLDSVRVVDFRRIIADAHWQKIKAYEELALEISQLPVPFDCYYYENKDHHVRIRTSNAAWLIPAFEEIRHALFEKREPDFTFLNDNEWVQELPSIRFKEKSEGGFNSHLAKLYQPTKRREPPKPQAKAKKSAPVLENPSARTLPEPPMITSVQLPVEEVKGEQVAQVCAEIEHHKENIPVNQSL